MISVAILVLFIFHFRLTLDHGVYGIDLWRTISHIIFKYKHTQTTCSAFVFTLDLLGLLGDCIHYCVTTSAVEVTIT